jgi:hypothetical protein
MSNISALMNPLMMMRLDDEDDLSLALATLFHSDIEDSDFDGFMSD